MKSVVVEHARCGFLNHQLLSNQFLPIKNFKLWHKKNEYYLIVWLSDTNLMPISDDFNEDIPNLNSAVDRSSGVAILGETPSLIYLQIFI